MNVMSFIDPVLNNRPMYIEEEYYIKYIMYPNLMVYPEQQTQTLLIESISLLFFMKID